MTIDWNRYGPAIVWTLAAGIIVALAKGQGSRFVHLLFRRESERATDSVMNALESKDGRVRLRAHIMDLFATELQEREMGQAEAMELANQALGLAKTSSTALEAISEIQKLQGASLSQVQEKLHELPRMTEILTQLTRTSEVISKEMQSINTWMARMDEREKVRAEERRYHEEHPNPGRRQGD